MDVNQINNIISDEMKAVDRKLIDQLQSDVVLISQLGGYIINSGGKRLRPMLALLAAKACGYTGTNHINMAAVIELIHTATLLHDDVVDDSKLRRNRDTANVLWGNEAAVLVGDFIYTRAFEMMVALGNMQIMRVMAKATNTIAEGEVLQLMNCNDPDTTEESYMAVIHSKTAKLFEAATESGAILANSDENSIRAMAHYGMHAGTAFQLIDDVLDYRSSKEVMGKNVGDDLAEGKPTLPLIHVVRTGKKSQKEIVRHAIETGGLENIQAVLDAIQETNALEYTENVAQKEAELARKYLESIPDSIYKEALNTLTYIAVQRDQ